MWSCWWYGIALSATSFYLGSVLVKQGNLVDEIEPVHASEHSKAINLAVKDWESQAFTDIAVLESWKSCGDSWEEMFTSTWPGMDD